MNFLDAASAILTESGQPLHYRDITDRMLARSLVETTGATPWETLNARLAVHIQKHGDQSPFMRIRPGVFALRAWGLAPEPAPDLRARGIHLPTWSALRAFLVSVDGQPAETLTALRAGVAGLKGEDRDFSNPETWLAELEPPARALGLALWTHSKGTLNPRYVANAASTATRSELTGESGDRIEVTPKGRRFVAHPTGPEVRELDAFEGVAQVLALVAEYGPARSSELIEPYRDWCEKHTGLRSDATMRSSLSSRLANLLDRALVEREGHTWAITAAGLSWLGQEGAAVVGDDAPADKDELVELLGEIKEQQDRVRARIRTALEEMDPYAFEHLIKRLLDEMGYDSVEVTKASGDKGVDVVAKIRVGITPVTELIQAKKQKANVGRPVLDALRGSLYRWNAQRGTVITTAAFTKGAQDAAFDVGAAPLQLIDGDRLVELLVENGIGIKQQPVKLWRFDAEPFVNTGGSGAARDADEE